MLASKFLIQRNRWLDIPWEFSQIILELSVLEATACLGWRQGNEEERKGEWRHVFEEWGLGISRQIVLKEEPDRQTEGMNSDSGDVWAKTSFRALMIGRKCIMNLKIMNIKATWFGGKEHYCQVLSFEKNERMALGSSAWKWIVRCLKRKERKRKNLMSIYRKFIMIMQQKYINLSHINKIKVGISHSLLLMKQPL